jgi:hypothetical protein
MTKMNGPQPPVDNWTRLGRTIRHFLRVLLRTLLIILVVALLGAAVYFGAPWVYREIVQPVQSSVAQLDRLQRQLDDTEARWAETFSEQQGRITDLEGELDGQREGSAILQADLQSGLDAALDETEARMERIETVLADQRTDLEELSLAVAAIGPDYAPKREVTTLRDELGELQEQVVLSDEIAVQIAALAHRVLLIQAWQEVLKTHLYLSEGNARDAETTLALATAHLNQASESGLGGDEEAMARIQAYLATAAPRLHEQPVIAAQNLESAWYELAALIASGV